MTLLMEESLGTVARTGETFEVTFERRLAKPLEKVWAAITVPERIADWLTEAEVELRLGGRFRLWFAADSYAVDGRIVELEPLRRLAWTWPDPLHPDSVVRFELASEGAGTRLVLTQTALPAKQLSCVTGGWHTHLEGLPGAADGVRTPFSSEREAQILTRYEGRFPA
jgi:uncharacterized protein YndB with AHSA1/START domain